MRVLHKPGPGARFLALTAVFVGCVHGDRPATAKPGEGADSLGATAPAAPAQAATPSEAAQQFVDAGMRGARLRATPCAQHENVSCGVHGVGVVKSFTLDSAVVSDDTARVTLHYLEVGSLVGAESSIRYLPRADSLRAQADTLVLVRESGAWRVAQSNTDPRVLARVAYYYFDLDDKTRKQISSDADASWIPESARPVFTRPAALTQLPSVMRDTLEERGCRVLQLQGKTTDNVVQGSLLGPNGDDWAVLCMAFGQHSIVVLPHDGGSPVSLGIVVGEVPGIDALPNPNERERVYGCLTRIFLVDSSALGEKVASGEIVGPDGAKPLSGAERRVRVHDGLGNGDCEGLSTVYYWTGGRWIRFAGGG